MHTTSHTIVLLSFKNRVFICDSDNEKDDDDNYDKGDEVPWTTADLLSEALGPLKAVQWTVPVVAFSSIFSPLRVHDLFWMKNKYRPHSHRLLQRLVY